MKQKHQRLAFIIVGLLCLSTAVAIILNNFQDNLVFFYSPSELQEASIDQNKIIRIGGLVEQGSVKQSQDGQKHEFVITDNENSISVKYKGILPPMFREGQGMVATGKLENDIFIASNLLTKHDENYMPPEVAKSLKESHESRGEK